MPAEIWNDPTVRSVLLSLSFIAGAFILAPAATRIVSLLRRWVTKRTPTELDDRIMGVLESHLRWIIIITGFYFGINNLEQLFPSQEQEPEVIFYANHVLYIATVFVISLFVIKVLTESLAWYLGHLARREETKLIADFIPLFDRILRIIVLAIAVIIVLNKLGQDVSGLVVSLGVGSFAVAFAAQDTIANMIAGFVIMIDRPFRVGDRILLDSGEKGDVFEIGLRSTKILDFDNTLIIVPNAQIVSSKLTNLSYPDSAIRVVINIGVAYGTDLDKVKSLLVQVCKDHKEVQDDPPPEAYFLEFGDSSLNVSVRCRVPHFADQWRITEELRLEINRRFEREGIEVPFPQRVIHQKKD